MNIKNNLNHIATQYLVGDILFIRPTNKAHQDCEFVGLHVNGSNQDIRMEKGLFTLLSERPPNVSIVRYINCLQKNKE